MIIFRIVSLWGLAVDYCKNSVHFKAQLFTICGLGKASANVTSLAIRRLMLSAKTGENHFLFQGLVEAWWAPANSSANANHRDVWEALKGQCYMWAAGWNIPMSFISEFFDENGVEAHHSGISSMLSVSVLAKRIRGLRRQLLPETRCPSRATLVGSVDVSARRDVRFVARGGADVQSFKLQFQTLHTRRLWKSVNVIVGREKHLGFTIRLN